MRRKFKSLFFVRLTTVEDKSKETSSPLPARKKVKNERGSIASYFNQSKTSNDEQKENQSERRSKSRTSEKANESIVLTNETNLSKKRRSKTKQEKQAAINNENHFLSSVHVEKTSLILFDEVRNEKHKN